MPEQVATRAASLIESPRTLSAAVLDPLADPRWAAFVDRAPGASVFHHPAWLALLGDQYRYPLLACCLLDDRGAVRAGLPIARVESRLTGRRLVALPFSDLCPPVGGPREDIAAALEDLRRELGMPLEVRGALPAGLGHPGRRYHHHVVRLEGGLEQVERGFRRSQAARGVRRARREGLVAGARTDGVALESFYALHLATRRRLGVPTQPKAFIMRLRSLFDRGMGFTMMASDRDGRPAAASVFLLHRGALTLKYSASDWAFQNSRPNNLVLYDAIRWGCEHGARALDLGRTDVGQDGLRAFKLAWGPEESELAYTHLADVPPPTGEGRASRALATVLRRAPPVAGRLVGELLYRHVG